MTKVELEKYFDDFLSEFNNHSVEVVDPTNFAQCFDLVVAWCWYIGLPLSIFTGLLNAYQIFDPSTQIAKDNFDFITNAVDNKPGKGDVVVWAKTYNGTAGHTGIATGNGGLNNFEAFEQNDPMGTVSHLKIYKYDHVIGWLKFKVTNLPQPMDPIIQRKASWYDRIIVAREGSQDTNQRTDVQDQAFTDRMIREKNRAVKFDQVGLKAKMTGDSNQWAVDEVYNKIQSLVPQPNLDQVKKDSYNQAVSDGVLVINKLKK